MPESVLTPAPVSTATVRPRSSSTACCTSASRRASRSSLATVLPANGWAGAITDPPPAAARLNNSVFRYVSDGWQEGGADDAHRADLRRRRPAIARLHRADRRVAPPAHRAARGPLHHRVDQGDRAGSDGGTPSALRTAAAEVAGR